MEASDIAGIEGSRPDVLVHHLEDRVRALGPAEAADPLALPGEQVGVSDQIVGIEPVAVLDDQLLDVQAILSLLHARLERIELGLRGARAHGGRHPRNQEGAERKAPGCVGQ